MTNFTHEKRYQTLNNYYLNKYHKKVIKISLNGGFSCPNIDGTVAYGGCSFCTVLGSGDFAGNKYDPIKKQFEDIKKIMHHKWPKDAYYIPYFQANTNTHGSLEKLKTLFEEAAFLDPNNVMISIGTRPDCLPDDVVAYLSDLNKRMPVQIELGLQSIHENTAKLINRAHDLKTFDDAVSRLRKEHIEVVVHIINGLPDETDEMMLDTVLHLNTLDIQGLKIHMLHIMEKTKMGVLYKQNPWSLLTLEQYVNITVLQLRHLKPSVVVHRVTGDAPGDLLIAPIWTKKKFVVSNEIDKLMRKLDVNQGDLYVSNH